MIAKVSSARPRAATALCALVTAMAAAGGTGCDHAATATRAADNEWHPAAPVASAAAGPTAAAHLFGAAAEALPADPAPKAAFDDESTAGMIGLIGHSAGGGGLGSLQRPAIAAVPASTAMAAGRALAASGPITAGRYDPLAVAAERAAIAEVAAKPRLSPNARYATTYRPGGAALAAFDAAVQRGQIPRNYEDLVGDFGARYAPALAIPETGAFTISAGTERAAVAPGGGSMNLLVALASSAATAPRAPLSVHFVLDVSGSMDGQAISDAKTAVMKAIAKLGPEDDFSVVTFSDMAQVLVPDGPFAPRRERVAATIAGIRADGGTNIAAGLDLGYTEARSARAGEDSVRLVMLLSDGHANGGDTDPGRLADRAASAFQTGVQTSSFGLGPDYDAALMSRIADRGAGGYYYLADSTQIDPALSREIDARLNPVATAVEIRVRLRPDVGASHVFGSRELDAGEVAAVRAQELAVDADEKKRGIAADRQDDATGGMRFFIPAFARADRHATMITLELPPGAGQRRVASVEVRYKDRLLQKNVTRELPVDVRWAASDAESAATADPAVERVEQAFAAGETILRAADRVDVGDRAGARRLIDERAAVLRSAAGLLGEPRFLDDAARLGRLAEAVGGAKALGDSLPLVVMLRGSAYGYL